MNKYDWNRRVALSVLLAGVWVGGDRLSGEDGRHYHTQSELPLSTHGFSAQDSQALQGVTVADKRAFFEKSGPIQPNGYTVTSQPGAVERTVGSSPYEIGQATTGRAKPVLAPKPELTAEQMAELRARQAQMGNPFAEYPHADVFTSPENDRQNFDRSNPAQTLDRSTSVKSPTIQRPALQRQGSMPVTAAEKSQAQPWQPSTAKELDERSPAQTLGRSTSAQSPTAQGSAQYSDGAMQTDTLVKNLKAYYNKGLIQFYQQDGKWAAAWKKGIAAPSSDLSAYRVQQVMNNFNEMSAPKEQKKIRDQVMGKRGRTSAKVQRGFGKLKFW